MSKVQSFSSMKTFNVCPRRYYLKYIEGAEPTAHNNQSAMDLGTAVHAAFETYYRLRLEGNGHTDAYVGALNALDDYPQHVTQARHLFNHYGEWIFAQELEPLAVELDFNVEVHGYPFQGKIDLIARTSGVTPRVIVVDWKIRKSLYATEFVQFDAQLPLYVTVARQMGFNVDSAAQCQMDSTGPVYPERTKEGRLSQAASTTERALRLACRMRGVDEEATVAEWRARTDSKKTRGIIRPITDYIRVSSIPTDEGFLTQFLDAYVATQERITQAGATGVYPGVYEAYVCMGCEYRNSCLTRMTQDGTL